MKSENYYVSNENYSKEYIRSTWDIAMGLQAVDNLKTSDYLQELATKNIEGILTNEEIEDLLYVQYENETNQSRKARTKEADMLSNRIAALLKNKNFSFSIVTFKHIHSLLFEGIYDFAGTYRKYNISKKEPILGGRSVVYGDWLMIEDILRYDFDEEKDRNYSQMTREKIIKNIVRFTSNIWQVHPFGEGNTRTTAVFIERYLNSMGFQIDNTQFKKYSKYFRNALVRANYMNISEGIEGTSVYLERFFENLLYGGGHVLQNRDLILSEVI